MVDLDNGLYRSVKLRNISRILEESSIRRSKLKKSFSLSVKNGTIRATTTTTTAAAATTKDFAQTKLKNETFLQGNYF